MQETIALLAPALVALGFYNHLNRNKLSTRKLVFSFGVFALLVNLCSYMVLLFLFNVGGIYFEHKSFAVYLLIAGVFAFVLPFIVNLVENAVSIEVKRNAQR